jgi:lipid II:glycine glycyltransferase (peptidoglycan interpeptide bridge formation enzyme)
MTSYCIFQEPWWLDAVAGSAWQSLEVSHGGEIVARMPIVLRRKFGFAIIRQPPLTPILGPWIRPSCASAARRMTQENRLLNDIIDHLPRWDYFEASFHHRVTNWLPFYWRGFEQTTRYTYVLDQISDLEKVWWHCQENVRRNIRKAQRKLQIRTDLRLNHLLDLVEATFRRQARGLPFGRELMQRIDAACSQRDARRMFFAEDAQGRIHAALYLVVDENFAYYLLGGADPELRESGAQNLLLWEAIRCASGMGLKFDFEGSMVEPIERVFRAFGARQVPYLHVYGARPLARILLHILPEKPLRTLWLGLSSP